MLEDPYGVVRHIANKSLGKQPGFDRFEFDFLATAPERMRLAKRAIAQWNELPRTASDTTGKSILINSDRQLMATAIQALLNNRDNRPFTLKELPGLAQAVTSSPNRDHPSKYKLSGVGMRDQ